MKLIYVILLVTFSYNLYSQSPDDYRTISGGNWTTVGIWEVFDGTTSSWIPATNYPGQVTGTQDVVITQNHSVNINTTINNPIQSITVGDSNGDANNISTLQITGNSYFNTSVFTLAYDGLLLWAGNFSLTLPDGASFSINRNNPYPANNLGEHYGVFVNTSGCNVQKELIIGSTTYTNCNGGGSGNPKPTKFEDVNDAGGNLSVFPSSNSPVCLGNIVTLTANPGGTDIDDTPITYTWSAISPTSYSFSSSIENPNDTPTTNGTYIYEVIIENASGLTSSGTTTVEVTNCNKRIITNRNITYRVKK